MKPTETDIQIAKQYLLERLDAERSMLYHLERLMRKAAEDIVALLYAKGISVDTLKYNRLQKQVEESINEIILNLQESIADIFETLAIADHEENRNTILPFILGENHGMTFDERLTDYVEKYKNELLLLIGAGLLLGIGKSALAKSIGDNLRQPYANPMLKDGIEAPLTYGRGKSNAMYNAIGSLTRNGIAGAWMKNFYIETRKNGCIGWLVQRGSSYPCEICQAYVGLQTSEENLPPFHLNCVCYAVPIYLK
ncbi:MAG: hypothetical protein K1V90_09930 [Muribaculaceae bacterium]